LISAVSRLATAQHLTPRGHLWLDSLPAMLEAPERGLGVTRAMSPLIKARPSFGKKLVVPFAFEAAHSETIYLVSRTEQVRDRGSPRCGAGYQTR
jgi:LysR family glycine cleavage system transcriptional activator